MNTYLCTLVNRRGAVIRTLKREGTSKLSVMHALELTIWPVGTWVIEEIIAN